MSENPDDASERAAAREAALRYLANREHSRFELRTKLGRKGLSPVAIEATIESLVDEGLADDRRFAEAFARSRYRRCQGPLKIRAELGARGVSDTDIQAALGSLSDDWLAQLVPWMRRRARTPLDRRERSRLYQAACRRGFAHDQALAALDRLAGTEVDSDIRD